ncbi:MAG TPA: response regulator [Marinobacterium sp.]|nr:response regulator [Marinobacterium sp.]
MEKDISKAVSDQQLREIVRNSVSGDTLNTTNQDQFELIKKLLIEYKRVGLRLCLLDDDGYILRQISSRSRTESIEPGLNTQQRKVLKALERVLKACEREKIALVGYSDSLVALPQTLLHTELASAEARELETFGVYIGADLLKH